MKKKYVDYGWLVVLFAILLMAMIYSILVGKKEGFESKDLENKLVFFYNENCMHCKDMMDEWNKASADKNNKGKMAKVEISDKNQDMKDKYHIKKYPTILVIDGAGNPGMEYPDSDPRTASGFTAFIKTHLTKENVEPMSANTMKYNWGS